MTPPTLAKWEGVSPSYFTRLVRLNYLAPDISQAILEGRQPRDLAADKLLAHSRHPLLGVISESRSAWPEPHQHRLIDTAVSCWCTRVCRCWHEQLTVLGFA
jgi:hypothetical protein